jgi:hypothetical protein
MPDDDLLANAESIWLQGKQAERLAIIRLVRDRDPAVARALLEGTWQQERATFRAEAIDLLSANISHEDLTFLEVALNDRAQSVRERAETLLLRIPGSSSATAALAQAEPFLGKRLGVQIVVRPPERDTASDTERAAEITDAIGRVPPAHWVERLGKSPSELARSMSNDRTWGYAVISGWTAATLAFNDADWAAALITFWFTAAKPKLGAETGTDQTFVTTASRNVLALLRLARKPDAERALADQLTSRSDISQIAQALMSLTRPWSIDFSDRCLRNIGDQAASTFNAAQIDWRTVGDWAAPLQAITLGVPAGRFQHAIDLMNRLIDAQSEGSTEYLRRHWRTVLQSHIDTLLFRQRINEEIPG